MVQRIGGIGVGEIGRALVTGLCEGPGERPEVFLSPRSARGGVLAADDEAAFNVFSALTATLTTHLSYLATLSTWAAGHGVPPEVAEGYVRGLFQGLGRALGEESRSLARLAADHETPNGSNERVRTTWFTPASSQALAETLDDLLDRLT